MPVFLLLLFFASSFLFQLVTVLPGMLDLSMVAPGTREPSRFVSVESGVLSVILTGARMMEELYADNWDTRQQVRDIRLHEDDYYGALTQNNNIVFFNFFKLH